GQQDTILPHRQQLKRQGLGLTGPYFFAGALDGAALLVEASAALFFLAFFRCFLVCFFGVVALAPLSAGFVEAGLSPCAAKARAAARAAPAIRVVNRFMVCFLLLRGDRRPRYERRGGKLTIAEWLIKVRSWTQKGPC